MEREIVIIILSIAAIVPIIIAALAMWLALTASSRAWEAMRLASSAKDATLSASTMLASEMDSISSKRCNCLKELSDVCRTAASLRTSL